MPTSAPLPAVADRIRSRAWSHADVRCALDQPGAMAWVDGDALVCAWGPPAVVHAVEADAFGPTAALLAELRDELPAALELRAGPGGGGILTKTHQVEMLGPIQRFAAPARARLDDPDGLRPLTLDDLDQVRALADKQAWIPPRDRFVGWLGVERKGQLLGAIGPIDTGDDTCLASPPALARAERRTDLGAQLLAALARNSPRQVVLDIRADRRNQATFADLAGFRLVASFERWWCVRR